MAIEKQLDLDIYNSPLISESIRQDKECNKYSAINGLITEATFTAAKKVDAWTI